MDGSTPPTIGITADMSPEGSAGAARRVLWLLIVATFLIFFQAFMVAPLIPRLSELFGASPGTVGFAVPIYLIPYGVMTLVWGPLSDRVGRGPVILGSLGAFVVLTAATAAADSVGWFLVARLATAVGASGVVPISLALIADVVPFAQRGRALGWFFGAMAGGIAFGSSAGALLEPVIGWRGLFLAVGGAAGIVLGALVRRAGVFARPRGDHPPSARDVLRVFVGLLGHRRAQRTYAFVLFNAVLHSGVYTWLGVYFERRYGLSEAGIGLALLGYGVPGFVLGPIIGRVADRSGRRVLIPIGVAVGAAAALVLAPDIPLALAVLTVALLSLGYDLTQPLLAGIVTQLSQQRGQAMGLNVFTLFVGFGLGSLLFQVLLDKGFTAALVAFGAAGVLAAGVAVGAFRNETVAT